MLDRFCARVSEVVSGVWRTWNTHARVVVAVEAA